MIPTNIPLDQVTTEIVEEAVRGSTAGVHEEESRTNFSDWIANSVTCIGGKEVQGDCVP